MLTETAKRGRLSDLFALKAEPVPEVMTVTLDILIKAPISTSAGEDYSALWYVVISVHVFTPEQSALDSVGVGLNEVIIVVSNEKALDNVCCVVHNSQHIAQTNSTPPLGGPLGAISRIFSSSGSPVTTTSIAAVPSTIAEHFQNLNKIVYF